MHVPVIKVLSGATKTQAADYYWQSALLENLLFNPKSLEELLVQLSNWRADPEKAPQLVILSSTPFQLAYDAMYYPKNRWHRQDLLNMAKAANSILLSAFRTSTVLFTEPLGFAEEPERPADGEVISAFCPLTYLVGYDEVMGDDLQTAEKLFELHTKGS